VDQGRRRGRLEGQAARQHLEEHDPDGVHVHLRLGAGAVKLLRRHVGQGAEHLLALGEPLHEGVVDAGGEAEVEQLHRHRARLRQAQVRRLDVAVHDAGVVHLRECLGGLGGDVQGLVHPKAVLAGDAVLERLPPHQLHHVVGPDVLFDAVVGHLGHARRVDACQRPGLALETLDQLVAPLLEAQHLEREGAAQGQVLGLENLAHPALADEVEKPIPPRDHRPEGGGGELSGAGIGLGHRQESVGASIGASVGARGAGAG